MKIPFICPSLFVYGITEQSPAPNLSKSMAELRNKVIHKGRLASKEEALTFGDAVLAIINPTLRLLKIRDNDFPTIISISRDVSVPDLADIRTWSPPNYYLAEFTIGLPGLRA